jgi:alpha-beta hydrolase superfamily lysophospholipase
VRRIVLALLALALLVGGCSAEKPTEPGGWVDEDVSFDADGLTIHGTFRHQGTPGPAALLISESGQTDRNGDNAVAGPVGNMRQLAEYLSEHGIATLRYDKVGTGRTGLGKYKDHPTEVGSAVYTTGARAAIRFLAGRPGVDPARLSVYALGEGTIHAMTLAADGAVAGSDAPKIHSLGLFQPLSGRYLDIITRRVHADVDAAVSSGAKTREQADAVVAAWNAAVAQARTQRTAPDKLPEGLSAILNAQNVKAVVEADAIDPVALAAELPATTPVLLTCSDADNQAGCPDEQTLIGALAHTALTVVRLKGVNHVLRDDPSDNVANYAKQAPLSPQLTEALNTFVTK